MVKSDQVDPIRGYFCHSTYSIIIFKQNPLISPNPPSTNTVQPSSPLSLSLTTKIPDPETTIRLPHTSIHHCRTSPSTSSYQHPSSPQSTIQLRTSTPATPVYISSDHPPPQTLSSVTRQLVSPDE
ncbi:hypothetical protein HanIR_Chr08g0357341 [Helianthus annuus]|nr:hypothetical protein HanIR_Chr08g0357341 [Helianthus annuus]